MIRYICADLYRAYRRIPRLIALAAVYGVITWAFTDMCKAGAKISVVLMLLETYVVAFIPLVFGLLEIAVVYGDDLNAKAMQSAIGMGLSRTKVVLSKLASLALLLLLDVLLFGLLLFAASAILHMGLRGEFLREFVLSLGVAWLKAVAYASLAMILALYSQNTLFAMLVHIALASGIANKALGMALSMKALAPLHLDRFLLTTEANLFYTQLLLGRFNAGALLAIVLYIAAGVAAASYLFSSIELEL